METSIKTKSLKVFTNCHGFNELDLVRAIWHKTLSTRQYVCTC